jgi:hypothetical protein
LLQQRNQAGTPVRQEGLGPRGPVDRGAVTEHMGKGGRQLEVRRIVPGEVSVDGQVYRSSVAIPWRARMQRISGTTPHPAQTHTVAYARRRTTIRSITHRNRGRAAHQDSRGHLLTNVASANMTRCPTQHAGGAPAPVPPRPCEPGCATRRAARENSAPLCRLPAVEQLPQRTPD